MALLQIRLLGGFQLICQGKHLCNLHQPRLESLLAYLILNHNAPLIRQQLAFLFWPDTSEEQALTNLRNLLFQLRKAWSDIHYFLVIDHNTIQWLPDVTLQLDVADFENTLNNSEAMTDDIDLLCNALHRAISLYQGDLLPALYDEWIAAERERLHLRYQQSLEKAITLLEARRDYAAAIDYAKRLLQDDPLREENYRSLMRLYALNGERAGALRSYHECVAALWRELEVEPAPATQALFQRILMNMEEFSDSNELVAKDAESNTPFVGRCDAWRQLMSAWQSALQQRPQVALITGEPGIGKTRLASELVTWVRRQGMASAVTSCLAGEANPAYAPVIGWLRSPPLQQAVAQLAPIWQAEIARLLPELLVQKPQLAQLLTVMSNGPSQHLFEALDQVIATARQPLLLVLDEMKWCDCGTLEWLRYLLQDKAKHKLLLVGTLCTGEIEENHPLQQWLRDLEQQQPLHRIDLAPLDRPETAQLITAHCGYQPDAAALKEIYRVSEGHPLYALELAQNRVIGEGDAPESDRTIAVRKRQPDRIVLAKFRALLQARISRLSPIAQEVLAIAALIGREFTFEQLVAVSDLSQHQLIHALDEGWKRQIIHEMAINRYRFSHNALTQVACSYLSQTHRHWLQKRIAQTSRLPVPT